MERPFSTESWNRFSELMKQLGASVIKTNHRIDDIETSGGTVEAIPNETIDEMFQEIFGYEDDNYVHDLDAVVSFDWESVLDYSPIMVKGEQYDPIKCKTGETISLPKTYTVGSNAEDGPIATGFQISGWCDNKNKKIYNDSFTVKETEVNFEANWKPVTIDANIFPAGTTLDDIENNRTKPVSQKTITTHDIAYTNPGDSVYVINDNGHYIYAPMYYVSIEDIANNAGYQVNEIDSLFIEDIGEKLHDLSAYGDLEKINTGVEYLEAIEFNEYGDSTVVPAVLALWNKAYFTKVNTLNKTLIRIANDLLNDESQSPYECPMFMFGITETFGNYPTSGFVKNVTKIHFVLK